jgi:hypothetical protein
MKKYRLTKITVKTREIISVSKTTAANETEIEICPVCHTPRPVLLPAAENSHDAALIDEQLLEKNQTS